MSIIIRNEEERDYRLVEEIAREAFFNLYFPGCNEHLVIHNMRNHKDFIKELSFVIEVDNKVVGSIFYTKSKIVSKNGKIYDTISFGPVSIRKDMHRMGLGRKLITHSINEAKKLGHRVILILGYHYHYEPYGFLGGKRYGISMEDGKFYKGLLVLPLYENALNGISGIAKFSDVFEVTDEEVENFDKNFGYKEKKFQDSQKEFELYVTMLDE